MGVRQIQWELEGVAMSYRERVKRRKLELEEVSKSSRELVVVKGSQWDLVVGVNLVGVCGSYWELTGVVVSLRQKSAQEVEQ